MRSIAALAMAAALLVAGPDGVRAQLHLGGQASLAFERSGSEGNESVPGVGLRAVLGLPAIPVEVHGSADYFFSSCEPVDCSFWEVNANAIFRISTSGTPLRPYLGAGLNYQSFTLDESDSRGTGLNILGGFELGATPLIRPFVEARYEIINAEGLDNQLLLTAGIIL